MLNKNQSHKRNLFKYAFIIPALIGFVLLFQVKVIAQQKEETTYTKMQSHNEVRVVITKNSTDAEMKNDASVLKKDHGITLKCSKVKRNNDGEITGIKVEFKDKDGNKGVSQVDGKEPIKPIHFYKNDSGIGFGKQKEVRIFSRNGNGRNEDTPLAMIMDDSLGVVGNFNFDFDMDVEAPKPPEAPEAPFPKHIWNDADVQTRVVVKKDGKKSLVILNGKIVEGDQSILSKKELDELLDASSNDNSYTIADAKVVVNGKDLMVNAKKQMQLMKFDKVKTKAEIARARSEMNDHKPEMEAARIEMDKAREELIKAKAEMNAARAEYIKAKEEVKSEKK